MIELKPSHILPFEPELTTDPVQVTEAAHAALRALGVPQATYYGTDPTDAVNRLVRLELPDLLERLEAITQDERMTGAAFQMPLTVHTYPAFLAALVLAYGC